VKADVKSDRFRYIKRLVLPPLFLLWGCVSFVMAFWFEKDRETYKKFGIRVITFGDNESALDDRGKIYAALELLNHHDKEKLELVKKYFRIIYLLSKDPPGCGYFGSGVCFMSRLHKIDAEKRVDTIITWLVYEASRVEFAGTFGSYMCTSEEIKNLCKEAQRQTLQKICK
jgi:hypothetical protein